MKKKEIMDIRFWILTAFLSLKKDFFCHFLL